MIELSLLTCKYEQKIILDELSLLIENHLTILGSNGSGKSTLAKAICDLIEFDGAVKINAKNIKEFSLKDKAQIISYIPAKLDVYDTYISVEEFVLLGRFPYKKSFFEYERADKQRVKKSLEFLNISFLASHSLGSLSSGETQLVLIAQALTQESQIIIFDEPTANLDPKNTKIIAKQIKKLKENHQVILITHDLHLAHYIDSSVFFINNKKGTFYKENFFNAKTLEKLYGIAFDNLAVKYD